MTDSFYTHELWTRSAYDETDREWNRAEDTEYEWDDNQKDYVVVAKTCPLRARVEIEGQNVILKIGEKIIFNDECEYQFRPIAPT